MYPLHDKDLDRLSRDAAEHYEVDSGPSGWEQLEKRLDQELPQQRGRRRFLFWLFFIVATTGSALTALLINSQPVTPLASGVRAVAPAQKSPDAVNSQATAQADTENATKKHAAPENGSVNSIDKNTTATPSTGDIKQPADATKMSNKAPLNAKQEMVPGNRTDAATTNLSPNSSTGQPVATGSNHKKVQPGTKTNSRTTRPGLLSNDRVWDDKPNTSTFGLNRRQKNVTKQSNKKQPTGINDKNDVPVTDPSTTTDREIATTQEPVTGSTTTPATDKPANEAVNDKTIADNNKPGTVADSTATPLAVVKPKKTKSQQDQQRGLEFGIVGGPDATAVKFGPLSKAGYNVGLQIGYRISDRWSVNTGVIYTTKYYKADSQDFKPKNPWYRYIKLKDGVKGNCSMFDIPVNVRYDVSFNNKRRFFVSTGLSTYLMDNQNYSYTYYTQGGSMPYPKDTSYTANYNYLFSVLNLSAGYERAIGKNFSLQVEPYLKLPLKGLGYGYMRMDSYGIFFSLKYRPGFGSKNAATKK
jgi:hypothetical protein